MNNMNTTLLSIVCILFTVIGFVQCDYIEDFLLKVDAITEKCKKYVGATEGAHQDITMTNVTSCTQRCLKYCLYHGIKLVDGMKLAPYENFLAVHKKFQAGHESVLENADENVRICLGRTRRLMSTNDPCWIISEYNDCVMERVKTQLGGQQE